jgi:hypothetical protein
MILGTFGVEAICLASLKTYCDMYSGCLIVTHFLCSSSSCLEFPLVQLLVGIPSVLQPSFGMV